MAEQQLSPWPRPYFSASDQQTKIFFVCFGQAPLAELELDRERFGLPDAELLKLVDIREHRRATSRVWFEGWWQGAFGVLAEQDLAADLPLLTTSDVCYTLGLTLGDRADLAPAQTVWGLARWLCARGASVVLDVHAFRFRTRSELDTLPLDGSDVQRDVKLVLETDATQGALHLMHTRGLCKFARPELLAFIRPEDAAVVGRVMNQIARTLMEGASVSQIRLRLAEGLEISTAPAADKALIESLGIEAAVLLARSDGAALAGVGALVPA